MAIALVKAGALATAATTSVSPAFGQATTAGNLLVACVDATEATLNLTLSITTTASGWVAAVSANNAGGATNESAVTSIWYKPNCGAGETAPTFTATAGVTGMTAVLSEWSGAALSSVVDKTAVNSALPGADSATDDVAILCTAMSVTKAATLTVTDSWAPTGGTAGVLAFDGTTKALSHFRANYYLLQGHGGSASDVDNYTVTSSTGVESNECSAQASFLPPQPVVTYPNPIGGVRSMRQAVNRAATFFSRVPWHERPGGLVVPDRKLILV